MQWNLERYQKNGDLDQGILQNSKIFVVGLGGLGGYAIEQLARLGVGKIIGVDCDVFETSNLNRQRFANENSIGQTKAQEAFQEISKINSSIHIETYALLWEKLEPNVYADANLIFDCLDNIPSKIALEEKALQLHIPLLHGAVAGWYGQVAVIHSKKMLSKIYGNHQKGLEQNLGNFPFVVSFIASFMVSQGIAILCKKTKRENLFYFFDLLAGDLQSFVNQ